MLKYRSAKTKPPTGMEMAVAFYMPEHLTPGEISACFARLKQR